MQDETATLAIRALSLPLFLVIVHTRSAVGQVSVTPSFSLKVYDRGMKVLGYYMCSIFILVIMVYSCLYFHGNILPRHAFSEISMK